MRGSGAGLDSNGRPIGTGGGPVPLTASFQSIQDNVFTPICSICHAGGAAPEGLRLDAVNSYAMIVGVPSAEQSSILRIKPGDPDNSYLVQKIEGHAAVGAQMPFGGPPLPAATIAVIRQWVTDGAQRAVAAATVAAFQVASAAPARGEVVLESPPHIVIGFSHELDATRVGTGVARLVRLSVSDGESIEDPVPVSVAVPLANPAAVVITPRQPLVDGRYRLIAMHGPGAGFADLGGTLLVEGSGEAVLTEFTVESIP